MLRLLRMSEFGSNLLAILVATLFLFSPVRRGEIQFLSVTVVQCSPDSRMENGGIDLVGGILCWVYRLAGRLPAVQLKITLMVGGGTVVSFVVRKASKAFQVLVAICCTSGCMLCGKSLRPCGPNLCWLGSCHLTLP